VGLTGDLEDAVELVHGGGAGEDGLPVDHLPQDAAHGPHVDAGAVLGGAEKDLGGAVPAGGDVVGQHGAARGFHAGDGPAEPEVADADVAVGVEQQVGGLDVAVEQAGGVHEEEGAQELVDDVLLVDLLEDVRPDHGVQVRLHKLENQVQVAVVLGPDNIDQADDVIVAGKLLRGGRGRRECGGQVGGAAEPAIGDSASLAMRPSSCRRTCRYITSRNVRWLSVAFRNASKHFFRATVCPDRLSTAFHTMPYACGSERTATDFHG